MSNEPVPTSIQILEKEYVVSCPPGEQESLRASANFLDQRMREARDGGNVIGTERIAVMAALNVIHDYLQLVRENEQCADRLGSGIQALEERIDSTLHVST